ncbi:endo-1,4-beta-xylanase [Paenibacillus endoradicis]|uniref:endo-1,4-beta-xylanase n=1 Tax=Paenibacillus endoradicis TaxID=2972487 RepID=UPI00215984F9|nr:endo-1,4-beta-xylanase [Paenibacillus endoradicis]MCR8655930.1 endo-1,4-beta-xylanase [Paenibacillus endoradicis]MCR8658256.1 endo-1,4-beta-xylanase [Paenibacillus endoradicis]
MNPKFNKKILAIAGIVIILTLTLIIINSTRNDQADNNKIARNNGQQEAVNIEDEPTNAVIEPTNEPEPSITSEVIVKEIVELSVEEDIPSLYEVYSAYFPIGAALEPFQTTGLKADLLKKHVNWIVAENAMKPVSLQPTEGNFNWTQADQLIEFAKANNMEVRFHTLVWHTQVGDWFFKDLEGKSMVDETDTDKREANKQLLLERLATHVRTIVSRYKDDIKSWDVVNEVIEPADPDGMRASEWYKITGTDYIETAFRVAREAGGPDIKLYINDYGTDDVVKRDRLYELVKEMIEKDVPIDGVGHQTHINIEWPPVGSIIASMEKFAGLGLDNLVTELDMSLYVWNDRSDFGEEIPYQIVEKQADRYAELFEAFKEHKDIIGGVVFWGIADDHTWLSTFPITRTEAPFLFDKQLHAKPAFWALVDPATR